MSSRSLRGDEYLAAGASSLGGGAQLSSQLHQQNAQHVLSDAVYLSPETIDRVVDGSRLDKAGGAGGEQDFSQVMVLRELCLQDGAHAVKFDA